MKQRVRQLLCSVAEKGLGEIIVSDQVFSMQRRQREPIPESQPWGAGLEDRLKMQVINPLPVKQVKRLS